MTINNYILLVGGNDNVTGGLERFCSRLVTAWSRHFDLPIKHIHVNTSFKGRTSCFNYLFNLLHSLRAVHGMLASCDLNTKIFYQLGNGVDIFIIFLLRRIYRKDVVCQIHTSTQWKHFKNQFFRRIFVSTLKKCQSIFVLSKHQQMLLDTYELNSVVLPTLLPEWINHPLLVSQDREESVLLFAGRIAPEKGLEDLLKVMSDLEGFSLKIAGTGESGYLKHLQKYVHDLNLDSRVQWLGELDESELMQEMQEVRVLVSPSRVDTFPLTLLEAIANNMCVVAYDIPGVDEIVNRYGGVLVNTRKEQTLSDGIQASLEGETNVRYKQLREDFAWPKVMKKYSEHLIEMGGKNAP